MTRSPGSGLAAKRASPRMPGPDRRRPVSCAPSSPPSARTSVVERSGYAGLPSAKASKGGQRAGSETRAKAASPGSATTGAPVWKRRNAATAGSRASGASSQRAASASASVRATAASSGVSGAGGSRAASRCWTVPGRASASSTARNTPCPSWTGSLKPGPSTRQSSPRVSVKKFTRVAAVRRAAAARSASRRAATGASAAATRPPSGRCASASRVAARRAFTRSRPRW